MDENSSFQRFSIIRICLYSEEAPCLLHCEWPEGVTHKDPLAIPTIESCVLDTPNKGECLSFVNGMFTRDGGVHAKEAMKMLTGGILKTVNLRKKKKTKKQKAPKPTKEKKEKKEDPDKPKLTVNDVYPHLTIIVSVWVLNPKFKSQTKSELVGPKVVYTIPKTFYNPIKTWDLIERLYRALDAKYMKKMLNEGGGRRGTIGNYMPANYPKRKIDPIYGHKQLSSW